MTSGTDDRETNSLLRSNSDGADDDRNAPAPVDGHALGPMSKLRRWWSRLLRMFGGNFLGAIMLVYFLQGSRVGFTNLAVDYYYQDASAGLGLSPARAQVLIAVSGVPWNLKPFYGMLSDVVPLFGTHRRGYLGVMGATATVSYLVLALLPPNEWAATACLFLISLGFAFNDVVVDAMVAAGAKKEPATAAGNLQSLAWGSYAVGSILGSVGGGVLYGVIGARAMFGMFGLIYAITVAMAINLREEPAPRMSKEKLALQVRLLSETIRVPLVWKAALYIFLMYAALPSIASATFKFWTDQDDLPRPDSFPPYRGWTHPLPPAPDSVHTGLGGTSATAGCEWFANRGFQLASAVDQGAQQCRTHIYDNSFPWLRSAEEVQAAKEVESELLAEAWDRCPQACGECAINRRGCIGFSPAFMGALKALGHCGYLAGVVLYNARYKTTDFRTIFFWAWFVQGLSILPDLMLVSRANVALGLPDHAFMIGDQVFHQMLGQLKHLPFLVLAARICPDHVEATLFATIMAISNVGGDVASFWGAVLLDWLGVTAKDFSMLWVAVLVRALCCAIPAIAAFFLVPDGGPSDAVSDFQADIVAQAKRRTSQWALADEIPLNSAQTGVRSSRLHVGEDQEDAGDAKE